MAKPRRVEEPAIEYHTTPKGLEKAATTQNGVRVADLADVRKNTAKLMQVHRKVLQKLAQ